jgi:branched-chain amino acid aminotransferase
MTTRKVYHNGQYVSEQEARISIFDSALMFGDMVFDMTRTYRQQPFRLRHHLERIYAGLHYYEIDCRMTIDEMEDATLRTLALNRDALEGAEAQIMHNVSRGPLGIYKSVFDGNLQPTVTINCWPYWWHLAPYGPMYRNGVHAVIPGQHSVPAHLIDPKVKNRSRVYYQLANMQAQKADPKAWALLTDDQGFITEGTGFNFFIVRNGRVTTPPGRNILLGVSRGAVMELLEEMSTSASELDFGLYEVVNADEAFFTATSFAIMPVTRLNGRPVGDGRPGPLTNRLIEAWSNMVNVDIVAQADEYAARVAEMERPAVLAAR